MSTPGLFCFCQSFDVLMTSQRNLAALFSSYMVLIILDESKLRARAKNPSADPPHKIFLSSGGCSKEPTGPQHTLGSKKFLHSLVNFPVK